MVKLVIMCWDWNQFLRVSNTLETNNILHPRLLISLVKIRMGSFRACLFVCLPIYLSLPYHLTSDMVCMCVNPVDKEVESPIHYHHHSMHQRIYAHNDVEIWRLPFTVDLTYYNCNIHIDFCDMVEKSIDPNKWLHLWGVTNRDDFLQVYWNGHFSFRSVDFRNTKPATIL